MNHKINVVKQKEEYVLYNVHTSPLVYSIISKSCNGTSVVDANGNLPVGSSVLFTPTKDGDYIIQYSYVDAQLVEHNNEFIISHYPALIKSFVANITKLLGDCGCSDGIADKTSDCTSPEAKRCLESQNIYGESLLVFGFINTLASCKDNYNVLFEAYKDAIDLYKCDIYNEFCAKEINMRIAGHSEYSEKLIKKVIAILYLLLYFYEKEITKEEPQYIDFLNEKYNWKELSKLVRKSDIDILEIEHLFMARYYDGCSEDEVCSFGCFVPLIEGFNKEYTFKLKEELNGVYDMVDLKNTCGTSQLYLNNVLYADESFKVVAKAVTTTNPASVEPGEQLKVNILFIGKKDEYSVINVPFNIDGVNKGKYTIIFRDEVANINNPPVITDIIKDIKERKPYRFSVADFEAHFFDTDGDILDKVVLVGNTSNFTLDNAPYVSGTIITRGNIVKLVYTPSSAIEDDYEIILNWKAYDSRGASSE